MTILETEARTINLATTAHFPEERARFEITMSQMFSSLSSKG